MSNIFEKKLREARDKLTGQDIFQPLETPKELWEYTPELVHRIAAQLKAYGFPYVNEENTYRRVFLRTEDGFIKASASVPPAFTVISIGDQLQPCFYLFLQIGIIQWNKKLTVTAVDRASQKLDDYMVSRGLADTESGERKNLLQTPASFWSSDVFADSSTLYELKDSWDVDYLLKLFLDPHKLIVIRDKVGRRHLALLSYAAEVRGSGLTQSARTAIKEGDLLKRIEAQYDAGRYS